MVLHTAVDFHHIAPYWFYVSAIVQYTVSNMFLIQRVEKELQEKAQAQAQAQLLLPAKRECGDGGEEPGHPGHAIHGGTLGLGTMPPFSFQLPDQPGPPPEPVIQNLANMSISGNYL